MPYEQSDTGGQEPQRSADLGRFTCKLCGGVNRHEPACKFYPCPHCGIATDDVVQFGHDPACPNYMRRREEGAALLDEVHDTLKSYVVWPDEHACVAFTLWIAATHAQTKWEHATRFVFKSPIKRCGKTRAQEVGRELVHDPLSSTNISVAALVHSISEDDPPTLVIDEADSIFGRKKDRPDGAEDLRGILNSGHSRGWPYVRWDPKSRERDECATFAMALIGGIGDLPDTIEDRGVVTSMRRRAPGERITQFRRKRVLPELHDLRDRLAGWVSAHHEELGNAEPDLPVEDRQADVWESLVAVADLAGGGWPDHARKACEHYCRAPVVDEATAGELLLKDVRDVWKISEEHLFTETILERLHKIEESPWGDWYGKPLTARNLAKLLRAYRVKSKNIRIGDEQAKGYRREDLADSWHRYVPSVTASQDDDDNHREQGKQGGTDSGTDAKSGSVPGSEQGKQASWDVGTDGTDARLERAISALDPDDPDHGQRVAELRAEEVRRRKFTR
jgi:Protein of unknown function (DUF3631)